MTSLTALAPAWFEIVRISVRAASAYRFQVFTFVIGLALRLYLLREIWTAVYDGRESLEGISADTQVVFITVVMLQEIVLGIGIGWTIQAQVTSGNVALDLLRPLGFLPQMVARQVGRTVNGLIYVGVLLPVALMIGSLRVPGPERIIWYLASLILAYVVGLLTWMLVGLFAFWIMHINAVRAMLQIASSFLGGALVPMWFMPDGLRQVLQLLPFQAIMFLPASIYAGESTGTELIGPFLVQLVWIAILACGVWLVWRRAQEKIVVQGG